MADFNEFAAEMRQGVEVKVRTHFPFLQPSYRNTLVDSILTSAFLSAKQREIRLAADEAAEWEETVNTVNDAPDDFSMGTAGTDSSGGDNFLRGYPYIPCRGQKIETHSQQTRTFNGWREMSDYYLAGEDPYYDPDDESACREGLPPAAHPWTTTTGWPQGYAANYVNETLTKVPSVVSDGPPSGGGGDRQPPSDW